MGTPVRRRRNLLLATVAVVATGSAALPGAAHAASRPWQPEPASYGVGSTTNVGVTMADGTVELFNTTGGDLDVTLDDSQNPDLTPHTVEVGRDHIYGLNARQLFVFYREDELHSLMVNGSAATSFNVVDTPRRTFIDHFGNALFTAHLVTTLNSYGPGVTVTGTSGILSIIDFPIFSKVDVGKGDARGINGKIFLSGPALLNVDDQRDPNAHTAVVLGHYLGGSRSPPEHPARQVPTTCQGI